MRKRHERKECFPKCLGPVARFPLGLISLVPQAHEQLLIFIVDAKMDVVF